MKRYKEHKHFFLGENKQWFPKEEFIVHMADPRCFIRFSQHLAMFTGYDDFVNNITEIQWIDGKPAQHLIDKVLTDAWNFLAIEERLLEEDLQDFKGEDLGDIEDEDYW